MSASDTVDVAAPETAADAAPEAAAVAAPETAPAARAVPHTAALGRSRHGEPRTYDFRRPTKLSREHVRILQLALEAFGRQGTTVLTSMLRTGARLDLTSIEQYSYDDYIATLPDPTFIATFSIEPLAGMGSLAYPLDSAMACLDHMLGGSGSAAQPDRPMTNMESSIKKHLLDRLLGELGRAFEPITPLEPVLAELEYNPQLAQTASGSETVMVASFAMQLGARESDATLVLPFSSFAPALNSAASPQLSESSRRKRQRATEALAERLNLVPVDVSVRFAPLRIASADLLSLAVDDVLLLQHPRDTPLEVTTNDVVFAHAIASNHRRRLAADVVPTPTTGKDTP